MLLLFPLRLKFKENFPLCDKHLNSIKTSHLPFQKSFFFSLLNYPSRFVVMMTDSSDPCSTASGFRTKHEYFRTKKTSYKLQTITAILPKLI